MAARFDRSLVSYLNVTAKFVDRNCNEMMNTKIQFPKSWKKDELLYENCNHLTNDEKSAKKMLIDHKGFPLTEKNQCQFR